ncbi:MAG: M23 family metallopeptidase [Pseudomonadota bacterium]|nr:M23 family metallopeptidase [Pseudomonadota bacterium]
MKTSLAAFLLTTFFLLDIGICGELVVPRELQQGDLVLAIVTPGSFVSAGERKVQVDEEGYFVFGLGRDYPPNIKIQAWHPDGTISIETYSVAQREYGEQHIEGVPKSMVEPDEKSLERIKREKELVHQARLHNTSTNFFRAGIIWPVNGKITGVYGTRRILNGQARTPHYGIDIAAKSGTKIVATSDGIVRLAANLLLSGNTVIIDHGHGISSTYLHMRKISVSTSQFVHQGELIGYVGSTGRSTGAHLDWRINWFDIRVDPQRALTVFGLK